MGLLGGAALRTLLSFLMIAGLAFGQAPQGAFRVKTSKLSNRHALSVNGAAGMWDLRSPNLLKCSEDFSNAAWTKSSVTVTAGQSDPIGGTAAVLLSATAPDSFIEQATITGINTFSVYLRAASATSISIYIYGANVASAPQDISVTTEWKRFTYTSLGTETAAVKVIIGGWTKFSTGEQIYAWGAQLNEGPIALPYTATTDLQRISVGGGGIPMRREIGGQVVYDPAPSPLSKYTYSNGETRAVVGTNLLKYTDFSHSTWAGDGGTKSTVYDSYSASESAALLTENSANSYHRIYYTSTFAVSPSTTYVISVYVKDAGRGIVALNSSSPSWGHCKFDLVNATTSSYAGRTCSISSVGSGWYRASSVFTSGASDTSASVHLMGSTSMEQTEGPLWYIGNGGPAFYVASIQLNPGTLPDRYTKTEGVALEPGYPWLQLGSTVAVDTNDPVRRLSGLLYDGVDDVAVGPVIGLNGSLTVAGVLDVISGSAYSLVDNKNLGSNGAGFSLYTTAASGKLAMLKIGNGTTTASADVNGSLATGWHIVSGTRDAGSAVQSYFDGVFGSKASESLTGSIASTNVIGVGNTSSGNYLPWSGIVSSASVYSIALSPDTTRRNHYYQKANMARVGIVLP